MCLRGKRKRRILDLETEEKKKLFFLNLAEKKKEKLKSFCKDKKVETLKNDIASREPQERKEKEKQKRNERKRRRTRKERGKENVFSLSPPRPLSFLHSRTKSLHLSHPLSPPPKSLSLPLSSFRNHPLHCIATLGLTALNTVRCTLDSGLARLVVSGNRIAELWNCLVDSRLQSAAGTVAVLMIWRTCERARCLDPISA